MFILLNTYSKLNWSSFINRSITLTYSSLNSKVVFCSVKAVSYSSLMRSNKRKQLPRGSGKNFILAPRCNFAYYLLIKAYNTLVIYIFCCISLKLPNWLCSFLECLNFGLVSNVSAEIKTQVYNFQLEK